MSDDANVDPGQQTGDGEGADTSTDAVETDTQTTEDNLHGFETVDALSEDYSKLKAAQPIVPEDLNDYKFDEVEGVEYNNDVVEAFRETSQKLGLTPEQYKGIVSYESALVKDWNDKAPEREAAALEEQRKASEAVIDKRKETLGADYDKAVKHSLEALSAFGITDLKDDPSLADNDKFFNFTRKIGAAISEGKLNAGGVGGDTQPKRGPDGKLRLSFPSMEKSS